MLGRASLATTWRMVLRSGNCSQWQLSATHLRWPREDFSDHKQQALLSSCSGSNRGHSFLRSRDDWRASVATSCTTARMMSELQAPGASISDDQDDKPLVAVAQMTSGNDREANMQTCWRLAQEAKQQGCCMLFLPECCSFIGQDAQETLAVAEDLNGSAMGRFRTMARNAGIWLSIGGFPERGPDAQHMYNTHVILDCNGDTISAYRKVHLFDVDVHNGPVLMESRSTSAGSQLVASDSPAGRLGVTICYDLRFPEVYQRLTFGMGAEVLLIPSAFTKPTGEAHWEVLLRARAIETQCYVIAAAQAGKHNAKRESYGDALAADPWGRIVARLPTPLQTGIATMRIDLKYLRSVRTRMPVEQHRLQGRACLRWD